VLRDPCCQINAGLAPLPALWEPFCLKDNPEALGVLNAFSNMTLLPVPRYPNARIGPPKRVP
jgi:hypothetical protein